MSHELPNSVVPEVEKDPVASIHESLMNGGYAGPPLEGIDRKEVEEVYTEIVSGARVTIFAPTLAERILRERHDIRKAPTTSHVGAAIPSQTRPPEAATSRSMPIFIAVIRGLQRVPVIGRR